MQVAMGAMAAASQSRGVALGSEAGHLLVHLLPLPDGLAVPTASDERVTVEIRVVEQVGSCLALWAAWLGRVALRWGAVSDMYGATSRLLVNPLSAGNVRCLCSRKNAVRMQPRVPAGAVQIVQPSHSLLAAVASGPSSIAAAPGCAAAHSGGAAPPGQPGQAGPASIAAGGR